MRRAELIGLRESHIDYHYDQLKALGKGNKERIIPVSRNRSRRSVIISVKNRKRSRGRPPGVGKA
ncbi:MAG: hypothetical protein U0T56_05640 [Ferruginibacter sp.]